MILLLLFLLAMGAEARRGRFVVFNKNAARGMRISSVIAPEAPAGSFEDHVIHGTQLNFDLRNAIEGTVHRGYVPPSIGTGTHIYVLDSGCQRSHPMFRTTQIELGPSFIPGEPDVGVDVLGHGTHVLGIAIQITPNATFICVRIFSSKNSGSARYVSSPPEFGRLTHIPKRRRLCN